MASAATALAALEVLAARQPLGVSELSRRLEVSKPAAQRALQVLAEGGWIQRSAQQSGRWVLTVKVLEIAGHMGSEMGLREVASPLMRDLVDATGEAAHLSVLDGHDIVLIDQVECTQPVRIHWPIGSRSPAYAAASGKAVLSLLPEEGRRDHVPSHLDELTEHTITGHDALARELAAIRARGFATQRGEVRDDVASVAAPLVVSGTPVAAVSVFMPAHRFPDDVDELGRLVVEVAAKIGASLSLRR